MELGLLHRCAPGGVGEAMSTETKAQKGAGALTVDPEERVCAEGVPARGITRVVQLGHDDGVVQLHGRLRGRCKPVRTRVPGLGLANVLQEVKVAELAADVLLALKDDLGGPALRRQDQGLDVCPVLLLTVQDLGEVVLQKGFEAGRVVREGPLEQRPLLRRLDLVAAQVPDPRHKRQVGGGRWA